MKKNFFLTLLVALLSTTATWAQFAPAEGTKYALKEVTSGLYLDVQTLGIDDPNKHGSNNISLRNSPCAIYFEQGTAEGQWKIKNVNGRYVYYTYDAVYDNGWTEIWNPRIGTEDQHVSEWLIQVNGDGNLTIARTDIQGKYISVDTPTAGKPLYCSGETGMVFALEEYVPTADFKGGKRYAFKVKEKDLYLDIQSLGKNSGNNDPNTHNASLSTKPCIIYFEQGETAGTWKIKNINGKYISQPGKQWNPGISDSSKDWTITFDGEYYKISRADGKFWSTDNVTNESPLYCDRGTGLEFELIEYTDGNLTAHYTILKTQGNTYLSLEKTVENSIASFQSNPASFNIIHAGYGIVGFQDRATNDYLGYNHGWLTTLEKSMGNKTAWVVSHADADGLATISRANGVGNDGGKNLGSDEKTNPDTGIFSNVGNSCNKWLLEETIEYETPTTAANGKKEFKSQQIPYYGGGNTLRFTLTKSDVTYSNKNAKRLSLSSFKLFDSNGMEVELNSNNFTGNNNKTYTASGNSVAITGAYQNGNAEDDWFEINLDKTDLGNSFSFSFVTENTTMDAKAFRIETSFKLQQYTFSKIEAPEGVDVTAQYNGTALNIDDVITTPKKELFTATDIPGYTWNFVIDKASATIYLVYSKSHYVFGIDAPQDVTVTVTYSGSNIVPGTLIDMATFSSSKITTTAIDGYYWIVKTDPNNGTATLTYISNVNPAPVVALVNRIGGSGTDGKFKFVLAPEFNDNGKEKFQIGNEDGKILIKGTTISAITTGLGWYLQNQAKINIAWNSLNEKTATDGAAYADLSNLPAPQDETRTCDAVYRYYLNYCTFGYSMTSWTWKRWQQEIDWMALHGVNMPLQIVGLEEVWRKFLTMEDANHTRKYGYTDEEAKAFVPGPAYTAWWGMNNLQGWGGTGSGNLIQTAWDGTVCTGTGGVQDDAWYKRQQQLATQIITRQHELGIEPVFPGFSGMVPTNFEAKSKIDTDDTGEWQSFARPKILDPTSDKFGEVAADYYACLRSVMGESQYYSMDPFHEGGKLSSGKYAEAYDAIYRAMEAATSGSQWVIQQWHWINNDFQRLSLNTVPEGRLIVLDLFSDGHPYFDSFGEGGGYAPQHAVFCAIPNFGGRSGLMGRLNNVTDNYFSYKQKYATIKGIGAAPEAIEQTPVTYDLLFQLPWMGSKPNVAEWIKNYATARYGVENAETQAAWELLRQGPLNYGADAIEGPIEDVWGARPNLNANPASKWGKTINNAGATYTKERRQMLIDATYKLLSQEEALQLTAGSVFESNYNYDLIEFGGGVMADYAYELLLGIRDAKNAAGDNFKNDETYKTRRDAFLALIVAMDDFKGTNLNFRLGKWTQEARDAAQEAIALGATTANADWYEFNNARTLITTWTYKNHGLNDYSYRSWQGLLKDYYLPRWQYFFEHDCQNPSDYFYFEWNWAHGMKHKVGDTSKSTERLTEGQTGYSYQRAPEGNTVTSAEALLAKYIIPVKTAAGTYYAYRYLTNNLSANYKVEGAAGGTINFEKFILADLDGATVTGEFINGTANDMTAVPVKSDIAGNTYDAVITLADGTVLNFKVLISSAEFVEAKEELAALIEKMETLTAQVGTFRTVATEVDLQATEQNGKYYIWCNNPHPKNNDNTDGDGGVAALLDEDAATYLHSNWSSKSSIHDYLQIDFGEAEGLDFFKIAGQQRSGGSNDRPKNIEIYGSDNGTNWTPITTVEDLPNTAGATWQSDEILVAARYSHLKFIVKTHDNYNQTTTVSRPYFHMAKFDLFSLAIEAKVFEKYIDPELTNEYAAERYKVLFDAIGVYKTATTQDEIVAARTKLQIAYDELKEKMKAMQNVELVKLIEKMDALIEQVADVNPTGKATAIDLQANDPDAAFYVSTNADQNTGGGNKDGGGIAALVDNSNDTYFHSRWGGTDVNATHYIEVDLGEGNRLSEFKFSYVSANGPDPTKIVVKGSNNGEQFDQIGDIIIKDAINSGATYGSDIIEAEQSYRYLRFEVTESYRWGSNANPQGEYCFSMKEFDLFKLTSTAEVKDEYAEKEITAEEVAVAYDEMVKAQSVLANGSYEEQEDAYDLLKPIYDALYKKVITPLTPLVYPVAGKVYRIKNYTERTPAEYQYHYLANSNASIVFPTSVEETDKSAMWVCTGVNDGKYKFVSALGTASFGWQGVAEEAVEYTISAGVEPGALALALADGATSLALTTEAWNNSGKAAFNQADGSAKAQDEYWSTDWYLEEVENPGVSYTASINKGNMWATMYLPYAVAIPDGVDVYYATGIADDDKTINLTQLKETIPARTAALLHRAGDAPSTEATVNFEFVLANDVEAVDNLFEGKILTTAICVRNKDYIGEPYPDDDYKVYLLVNYNGKEKFYWMADEYDANCVYKGDGSYYVKCDANKAYLKLENNLTNISSLSFRYDGTTGIDEVEGENEVKAIYDLQGRKINKATQRGMYIVNGKKVWVK